MSASDRNDDSNAKYKQFRNFMVNELGITRQDIEAWTKQSVANEVQKLLGGLNLDDIIAREVRSYTVKSLGNSYNSKDALVQAVASKLAETITLSVK